MASQSTDTTLWIYNALRGSEVWNLGQLGNETIRTLDKLVRQGKLAESRRIWGGISSPKTVWHLP